MVSDSNPSITFLKVQRQFLLVTIGLVVGFALSMFLYFLFSGLGSSGLFTSSDDSFDNKFGSVSDTDALLEQIAIEETSSTDFSISDLRNISEDIQAIDTEELRKAFQSSGSLPFTSSLHSIQEMLCEYLVEQSPIDALASLVWFEEHRLVALLRIMARHLAHRDLEESYKLIAGLKQPYRDIALEIMIGELDLTDEVMSTLRSFNNAEIEYVIAEQKHEQKIYESINQDPSIAFDLLLTDDVEDSKQADLFSQVLHELFQIEGFDALKRFDFVSSNQKLYAELIVPFVTQDRVGTLNYLEQLSQYHRTGLMHPLMANWIEVDVNNALDTAGSLTNPSFRSAVYMTLVNIWGQTRPLKVIERLAEIPREHRSLAVFRAMNTLGATNPDKVLSLLPSLKAIPGAFNNENERAFVYSWASQSPDQALKWVQENVEPESEQRSRLLSRVLGEYALVQPTKAMEVANTESPNPSRNELSLAYSVIDALLRDDRIDTAIGLLDQVPENTRAPIYADVAVSLVKEDRFDDVISLSSTFSATDKVYYYSSVARGLSYNSPSDVLTLVAKLPDGRVRTEVVKRILSDEWTTARYYTEEQLDTLRSLVAE